MSNWILVDHTSNKKASGTAMNRLSRALKSAGIDFERKITWTGKLPEKIIIAALNTDAVVFNLTRSAVTIPESIQLAAVGNARIISGSDERGLAYALMEIAERVEAYGEKALIELEDEIVSPTVSVRGIDKIVCNTGDTSWWMSEDYWRYYLGEMLAARFNRLVMLVGFDTSYLSPPYAFFVDVPEFPDVKLKVEHVNRRQHLAALRRLGQLAHEYGMEFVFATWQQTLWLAEQVSMVEGIEDLTSYCAAGIRELVLQCPEIDVLHLRVNHEAGVGTQITAEEYWFRQLDGLAEAKRQGRDIKLDLRAKGLTDPMIKYAKELGLDLTVSTKYWCEQAGLPYHLTQMRTEELVRLDNFNHSRRYSYSDMLKKPKLHKFLYRLWNDGSTDLLTWGDPDYVKRFAASMDLGNAVGFEIMPLLSLKGGPEDAKYLGWNLFDDPAYQPEGYEESRYWLSNRLFGRIGYNVNENDEAWMRPMRLKFGKAAENLMAAVTAGSKLIPFTVGYHMPVHPQLAYWAEFSTGGALFPEHNHTPLIKRNKVTYQNTEPGDAGLFYPIDAYVKDHLAGKEDGRYTPWQVVKWLEGIYENVSKYLKLAEEDGIPETPEARGVVLDMKMLGEFALYHRYKTVAAVMLCLYEGTKDKVYLASSIRMMRKAREKWLAYAKLGEKYHHHLAFFVGNKGVARAGNWKDFIPELDADLSMLESMISGDIAEYPEIIIPQANVTSPGWFDDVPACCNANERLKVTLKTNAQDVFRGEISVRYRHTNQMEGKFRRLSMHFDGGKWYAEIPADYIVPEWDLLVYFEAIAPNGDGMIFPGIWHSAHPLPYHIVEVK